MTSHRSELAVVVTVAAFAGGGCVELIPCSVDGDCPDGAVCADNGFCSAGDAPNTPNPDDAVGRFSGAPSCEVIDPPSGLGIEAYDAYLNCSGIAIVALGDVPEHTLQVTDQTVAFLLDGNEGIHTRMIEAGDFIIVRGDGLTLNDIPSDDAFDNAVDVDPPGIILDHRASLRANDVACGPGFFGLNTVVDMFARFMILDGVRIGSAEDVALV